MRSAAKTIELFREAPTGSGFSDRDYLCLHRALSGLADIEFTAVFARFWSSATIEEVGRTLNLSWDETDRLIGRALSKLKKGCLKQADFSRQYVRLVGTGIEESDERRNS
jgi:DNA-directed RNA polymerase specialized sigma24 family protein